MHESIKWKWSRSVVSDSSGPHGLQPASLHEFSRQEHWSGLLFSRESSWPRDQTQVFYVAGRLFTVWASREAHLHGLLPYFLRKIDPLIKSQFKMILFTKVYKASLMGKIFLSLLSIYGTLFLHSYCNKMPYIIVKFLSCLLNFVITLEQNHVVYFCFFTPV